MISKRFVNTTSVSLAKAAVVIVFLKHHGRVIPE